MIFEYLVCMKKVHNIYNYEFDKI